MKAIIIHDVNRDVYTAFAKGIKGAVVEGATKEDAITRLRAALDILLNYRDSKNQPVYSGNFIKTEETM